MKDPTIIVAAAVDLIKEEISGRCLLHADSWYFRGFFHEKWNNIANYIEIFTLMSKRFATKYLVRIQKGNSCDTYMILDDADKHLSLLDVHSSHANDIFIIQV